MLSDSIKNYDSISLPKKTSIRKQGKCTSILHAFRKNNEAWIKKAATVIPALPKSFFGIDPNDKGKQVESPAAESFPNAPGQNRRSPTAS
jgi:hypothetical protein